jgi:hypothetical protein
MEGQIRKVGWWLAECTYAWCLHCERASLVSEWKRKRGCPYPGCDGNLFYDGCGWHVDDWPRNENPEYPDHPESGKIYPLYKHMGA